MSSGHEPTEPEDVEDLDDEFAVDQPVPIACQWGMSAWCSTGRHHRCYFTTNADTIKSGTYGHHDGHVWICPCACHSHQGYPPCPHPDHDGRRPEQQMRPSEPPTQLNLF